MLNPDGVSFGNYRCSLAGRCPSAACELGSTSSCTGLDLNRQWNHPSEAITPAIWALKQRMARWKELHRGGIAAFCDIHGHSRSTDAFMYGCGHPNHCRERLLPYVCQSFADSFDFKKCNFRVQKSKQGTGRVVVWKEFGVENSFTLGAATWHARLTYWLPSHTGCPHTLLPQKSASPAAQEVAGEASTTASRHTHMRTRALTAACRT